MCHPHLEEVETKFPAHIKKKNDYTPKSQVEQHHQTS